MNNATPVILPEAFVSRMKTQLGAEYPDFEHELRCNYKVRGLRVNKTKITVDDYLKESTFDLENIPYTEDGFYFPYDIKMGSDPARHAGMIYLQDPSAMIPVNAVPVKPGWKVLDLCASPGGKTSQLSDAVAESGLVIANDIRKGRIDRLTGTVERLGLRNVLITMSTSSELCSRFKCFFDMVLIDAPCSCEGMFRKKPEYIHYWSEEYVQDRSDIQKSLLKDAAPVIVPGGYLVYSTCTFSVEENEEVIEWFLNRHPEYSLIRVPDSIASVTRPGIVLSGRHPLENARRFYPHIARGEGQFCAVMQRSEKALSDAVCPDIYERETVSSDIFCEDTYENITPAADLVIVQRFLDQAGLDIPEERIQIRDGSIWILPQIVMFLSGISCHNGVCLGRLESGEVLPHHGFFTSFGSDIRNRLELSLDDPLLKKYLQGADISCNMPNGFGAVTICGCAAGGFRSENGTLRNLYPEILRNWVS